MTVINKSKADTHIVGLDWVGESRYINMTIIKLC